MAAEAVMSAEAIRGYVRTLRLERKVTQDAVATAIRMPIRTYKSWELGEARDIKAPYLLRAIRFLRGSFDQIADLSDDATTADGEALAQQWARAAVVNELTAHAEETHEDAQEFSRLLHLLADGVSPAVAAKRLLSER